jgi:cold shock CspA family protein
MQLPLQVTFRDVPHSSSVEAKIREKVEKLERFYDRILSCRVVVEAPHRRRQKGQLYHIHIVLTVPDGELVVSRDSNGNQAHQDPYVAVRDAFKAARRQLESYARRLRGEIKAHESAPHGRVLHLMGEEGYGLIESSDGREIYFHRSSVLNDEFDKLEIGSEVRFVEQKGDKGPQASTVRVIGKHHILN